MKMYEDICGNIYVFKQKLVLMKALEFVVQLHPNSVEMNLLTNTEIVICLVWRSFTISIFLMILM